MRSEPIILALVIFLCIFDSGEFLTLISLFGG